MYALILSACFIDTGACIFNYSFDPEPKLSCEESIKIMTEDPDHFNIRIIEISCQKVE